MSYSYTEKKRIRKNFGTFAKVMDLPNLIETQTNSYAEFLQADVSPDARKKQGLEEVFQSSLGGLQEDESSDYQNYTQGPAMYFNNTSNTTPITSEFKFKLQIQHSSQSSSISLGFMVIENSETVILNGTTNLIKGTDYQIDYFTGNLTLISARASDPSAELKITYDQNELISFDVFD